MVVGDGDERALLGVDEKRGVIYVMANERTPLERHLYRTRLDTKTPEPSSGSPTRPAGIRSSCRRTSASFSRRIPIPIARRACACATSTAAPIATLIDNALDASHPYSRYLDQHRPTEFGTLAGRRRRRRCTTAYIKPSASIRRGAIR